MDWMIQQNIDTKNSMKNLKIFIAGIICAMILCSCNQIVKNGFTKKQANQSITGLWVTDQESPLCIDIETKDGYIMTSFGIFTDDMIVTIIEQFLTVESLFGNISLNVEKADTCGNQTKTTLKLQETEYVLEGKSENSIMTFDTKSKNGTISMNVVMSGDNSELTLFLDKMEFMTMMDSVFDSVPNIPEKDRLVVDNVIDVIVKVDALDIGINFVRE